LGQAKMEQPSIKSFNSLFSMPIPQTCIEFLCLDLHLNKETNQYNSKHKSNLRVDIYNIVGFLDI